MLKNKNKEKKLLSKKNKEKKMLSVFEITKTAKTYVFISYQSYLEFLSTFNKAKKNVIKLKRKAKLKIINEYKKDKLLLAKQFKKDITNAKGVSLFKKFLIKTKASMKANFLVGGKQLYNLSYLSIMLFFATVAVVDQASLFLMTYLSIGTFSVFTIISLSLLSIYCLLIIQGSVRKRRGIVDEYESQHQPPSESFDFNSESQEEDISYLSEILDKK